MIKPNESMFVPRPLPPMGADGTESLERLRIRLDNERQQRIIPTEDPDAPQPLVDVWLALPTTRAAYARLAEAR